ncbi:phage holin family protein [Parerythrobacter aurantius]|uniref:phage holin family protein n=1 Tax=Parerythrobacter aurantius TaxID=3127706 RepID=UPI00324B2860
MLEDTPRTAQSPADLDGRDPSHVDVPEGKPSLADDIGALVEDGKTYLAAEFGYQKTRAAYAGEQTKQAVIAGLAALAFLHLALIGLVVGLIFSLASWLTPLGSTALVVGLLLIGVAIFGRQALRRARALGKAFEEHEHDAA